MIARLLFPLSQNLYNRRGIISEYNRYLLTEFSSEETLKSLQNERICRVLSHAAKWVPYYSKILGRFKPNLDTIDQLTHLLPPLSRDNVIGQRLDLIDRRYTRSISRADRSAGGPGEPLLFSCCRPYPLVRNMSSGSTGAPVVFYENGTISATSWANELRLKSWFGLKPGNRESRLVRVSPDYVRKSKVNMWRKKLWNQQVLPGINLTEEEFQLITEQLNLFNPRVVWGITSAAAGLARYIRENSAAPVCRPKLIITWAAPLHGHEKAIIEETFKTNVTNMYGMREVGHIGGFCPAGALHLFQESHYLETDDNGELLVTSLNPSPMPFIRYRTGDLGEVVNERCPCGRHLQIIKNLSGRTGEAFYTKEGKMISTNFWGRAFMDADLALKVKRFQIVYTKNKDIKVRLILNSQFRTVAEKALKQIVEKNFGKRTKLTFDYVDDIPPQLSGKYQMVINESE
ncbi:Phenylacetate-CoA ligase [Chitinispirillum alkaliphilum]|nr:Phenylacetate-CoA ligase [Chitinispirillum alkaliphilum]